jgi:4-amino-4-deoxy-L-arabinose transferase-like glycosyltransferase
MQMKRVWNYIVTMWQPASILIAGTAIIASLFVYRIGGLMPGASSIEVQGRTDSFTIQKIVNNPVNAPYKSLRFVARHVHNTISSERLVSGLVAGLSVILFYLVVRHFCNRYAAVLASIMFATSTSLLSSGRLATPNILLVMLLALLACGYHLRFNQHHTRSWLITSAVLGLSLYVPGMVYFIVAGALWQFRTVRNSQRLPKPSLIGISSGIVLLIIAPLLFGFITHPGIWREYLGLSTSWPTITGFLKTLAAVPYGIFIAAPKNPVYRIGKQAVLDVFAATMLILGCITLVKRYKLDRLVLLLAIFILAALFTAISGNYENSFILLPFIYFCIAIGIGSFLEQWRKVFPLNPLARILSLGVVGIAVLISVNFQTRRYFIAWPHNAEARAVFTLK